MYFLRFWKAAWFVHWSSQYGCRVLIHLLSPWHCERRNAWCTFTQTPLHIHGRQLEVHDINKEATSNINAMHITYLVLPKGWFHPFLSYEYQLVLFSDIPNRSLSSEVFNIYQSVAIWSISFIIPSLQWQSYLQYIFICRSCYPANH